jgi:hypothetical protein
MTDHLSTWEVFDKIDELLEGADSVPDPVYREKLEKFLHGLRDFVQKLYDYRP